MFEMAADNHYMYIFKYRGCRFEMAAGPVASKCLQTGPSEYPAAPGMLAGKEGSDSQAAKEGPARSK